VISGTGACLIKVSAVRHKSLARDSSCSLLVADSVGGQGNAIGRVRPSVGLFPRSLLNQLTFDLDTLQGCGSEP